MKGLDRSDMCPRCGVARLKTWVEMDRDERLLAEKLPASAKYTSSERKKHRFCTRCWFEETVDQGHLA
jgi:hypothetical protein